MYYAFACLQYDIVIIIILTNQGRRKQICSGPANCRLKNTASTPLDSRYAHAYSYYYNLLHPVICIPTNRRVSVRVLCRTVKLTSSYTSVPRENTISQEKASV